MELRIRRLRNNIEGAVDDANESDVEYVFDNVAHWICSASYEKIDKDVAYQVKRAILDGIVSYLVGCNTPEARVLKGDLVESGTLGALVSQSTKFEGIIPRAVYVGAAISQIHDVNDGHPSAGSRGGAYHPGRVIIPASLVLAQRLGLSSEDFMVMVALGYDVALNAMNGPLGSPSDAYGVAGLASYALGFTQAQTSFVLKVAGFMAPRSGAEDFEINNLTIAQQARAGVEAALLVKDGYPLSRSCSLSGKNFSFSPPQSLGKDLLGLYFKPYPSCRSTHQYIEAAKLLRDKILGYLDSVSDIYIYYSSRNSGPAHYVGPSQYYKSYEFSISYCVAVTLVDGEFGVYQFSSKRTNDEFVQKLQKTVTYIKVEDDNELNGTVCIKLTNGNHFSEKSKKILGSSEKPLSNEEIALKLEKFTPLTSDDSFKLLNSVMGLGSSIDLKTLVTTIVQIERKLASST